MGEECSILLDTQEGEAGWHSSPGLPGTLGLCCADSWQLPGKAQLQKAADVCSGLQLLAVTAEDTWVPG